MINNYREAVTVQFKINLTKQRLICQSNMQYIKQLSSKRQVKCSVIISYDDIFINFIKSVAKLVRVDFM